MHGALLGTLAQREIRRSPVARRGQHLVLCGENPHPDIRDHDGAEQRPDVHERRASGELAAEKHGDGGEQYQRNGRRDGRTAREVRAPKHIVDQPAEDQQPDAEHDGGAAANAGDAGIEQIRAAEVVDEDEQRDPRNPRQHRFPFEPVQHCRYFPRSGPTLLHLIEAAAVDHPQVPLHARLRVFRCGERAVQPDEIEGTADPRDAGDEVRPPQQQICPIAEPAGHGAKSHRHDTFKPSCPFYY